MKKNLKWSPARPIRKNDNLISSTARANADSGFIPTYLNNEKRENMCFIMTNEYMRKWFNEREEYNEECFIRKQAQQTVRTFRRRHIQKMLIREKREKHLPIISIKRFENVSKRTNSRWDNDSIPCIGDSEDAKRLNLITIPKAIEKSNITEAPYQRYKPDCLKIVKKELSEVSVSNNGHLKKAEDEQKECELTSVIPAITT